MRLPLFLLWPTLAASAWANVTLAPVFGDHAVLQRGKPVPVWGTAGPGENVSVEFRRQVARTKTDAAGRWTVVLAPLAASGEGADLVVTGANRVTLHDVVVGEVWLCAGQSNMEFPLRRGEHGAQEVTAANHPLIRQLRVEYAVAATPQAAAKTTGWQPAAPASAGSFTAVGYFFARAVQARLGVPVGLIDNARGGSPIEAWLSAEALAADPAFAIVGRRWAEGLREFPEREVAWQKADAAWLRAEADAKNQGPAALAGFAEKNPRPGAPHGPGHYWTPAGLYNAMAHPLFPVALRGVLWYQGESNVEKAAEYRRLFVALIRLWRTQLGQGDVPFYWVQLPNYDYPRDPGGMMFVGLREAQAQALAEPGTAQVVTIDVGDPANVHPVNKRPVGERLARIALARLYGEAQEDSGPAFDGAEREGASLRVRFRHAAGLASRTPAITGLEIAGEDRKFVPAAGRIEGITLVVSSPRVPAPVAVRYAWSGSPEASLSNAAGLPAAPFRSDRW